jgi:hypothetical protein
MFDFLMPNNVYQVISNIGIFVVFLTGLLIFKRVKIGKDGLNFEKDDAGKDITLKTINEKIERVEKQVSAIQENDRIQSLDILRINFYLQKQPDETKLVSGLRYLKNNGNGRTREDIEAFIGVHQGLYDAITAIEPALRLEK